MLDYVLYCLPIACLSVGYWIGTRRSGVLIRSKDILDLADGNISEQDFWQRVEAAVVKWVNQVA